MATLFMTIGFPGSGKSTWAREQINDNTVIVSSDDIRNEVFGNADDQTHNTDVFEIMHKRTIDNLTNGINVIYDATNISRKYRKHLITSIPNKLNVHKVAVVFATPIEICHTRNQSRDRVVPDNVINRMYKSFQMPHYDEGFNEIQLIPANDDDYFETILAHPRIASYGINHDNPHHNTTLGKHTSNVFINGLLIAEREGLSAEDSKILSMACLYHDIGKNKTKVFKDAEGNDTDIAHYYGHDSVSAYDFMCGMINHNTMNKNDIIDVANLINFHMMMFNSTNNLKKNMNERLYKLLELLHEADINGG